MSDGLEVRPIKARVTIRIERHDGPPIEARVEIDESLTRTTFMLNGDILYGPRVRAANLLSRYRSLIGEAIEDQLYPVLMAEAEAAIEPREASE